MELDKISKNMLEKIANLHEIPSGAISIRNNGKSALMRSTANIEIEKKTDKEGINIYIHSSCQGEACHIPVVVSETGFYDLVYNDFYIEPKAKVTIVAGCGVHSSGESGHDGVHTFHIGEDAEVEYVENHFATGDGNNKILNPTTIIKMDKNSKLTMVTTQLGGVDSSNRKTKAELKDGAVLNINEKILTSRFEVAKTDFVVKLKGKNSKCEVVSRSVARDESVQSFKSDIIGQNECFGHVECDGILTDNAIIESQPKVSARHSLASLSHEAAIGKISSEQLVKLRTLGLTEKEAEVKIIEGFLK